MTTTDPLTTPAPTTAVPTTPVPTTALPATALPAMAAPAMAAPAMAAPTLLAASVATPAGTLSLVATPDGTVRAAGFGALDDLVRRLRVTDPAVTGAIIQPVEPEALPSPLREALTRYADGDPGALDTVPVQQPGGAFYQEVWRAMRRVPPATTVTYTELATMAGRPTAVRAAGTACARNLVAPFVPCHRIVRTDGTLGGYAYGLDAKRALLAHERGVRAS